MTLTQNVRKWGGAGCGIHSRTIRYHTAERRIIIISFFSNFYYAYLWGGKKVRGKEKIKRSEKQKGKESKKGKGGRFNY